MFSIVVELPASGHPYTFVNFACGGPEQSSVAEFQILAVFYGSAAGAVGSASAEGSGPGSATPPVGFVGSAGFGGSSGFLEQVGFGGSIGFVITGLTTGKPTPSVAHLRSSAHPLLAPFASHPCPNKAIPYIS